MAAQSENGTTHPTSDQGFFDDLAARYERMSSGSTRSIAKHIINTDPPISSSSTVLDNACGTGTVTAEILAAGLQPPSQTNATIHAVDALPSMLAPLQAQIAANPASWPNVVPAVMPAEVLEFADGTFSHSFTNFGISLFRDAARAAREIYRTLAAGGVAIVTTWADIGVVDACLATEARIRSSLPPFQWTINQDWVEARTLEMVMREAGFEHVEVALAEGAKREKDASTLVDCMMLSFGMPLKEWTEEQALWVGNVLKEEIMKDNHYFVDEEKGEVGVRMTANVAICRK